MTDEQVAWMVLGVWFLASLAIVIQEIADCNNSKRR